MGDISKWIGTFKQNGFMYYVESPQTNIITKLPKEKKHIISVYEANEYGIILKREIVGDTEGKFELGHMRMMRDCCGKIVSQCMEFVDEKTNGISQYYVKKKDKLGKVLEYGYEYIEAGFGENSRPCIIKANVVRID